MGFIITRTIRIREDLPWQKFLRELRDLRVIPGAAVILSKSDSHAELSINFAVGGGEVVGVDESAASGYKRIRVYKCSPTWLVVRLWENRRTGCLSCERHVRSVVLAIEALLRIHGGCGRTVSATQAPAGAVKTELQSYDHEEEQDGMVSLTSTSKPQRTKRQPQPKRQWKWWP